MNIWVKGGNQTVGLCLSAPSGKDKAKDRLQVFRADTDMDQGKKQHLSWGNVRLVLFES